MALAPSSTQPSGMALTPPSTPPSPTSPATSNHLSDIFFDSAPTSPTAVDSLYIPRLRDAPYNLGYLDETSTLSLQPVFDEAYPLGAVFGLRVGYILGVFEGICSAHLQESDEEKRCRKLVKEAREALGMKEIFGEEWWDKDRIRKYEVQGKKEEITIREVVNSHPVVRRWLDRVDEEMKIAGLKM